MGGLWFLLLAHARGLGIVPEFSRNRQNLLSGIDPELGSSTAYNNVGGDSSDRRFFGEQFHSEKGFGERPFGDMKWILFSLPEKYIVEEIILPFWQAHGAKVFVDNILCGTVDGNQMHDKISLSCALTGSNILISKVDMARDERYQIAEEVEAFGELLSTAPGRQKPRTDRIITTEPDRQKPRTDRKPIVTRPDASPKSSPKEYDIRLLWWSLLGTIGLFFICILLEKHRRAAKLQKEGNLAERNNIDRGYVLEIRPPRRSSLSDESYTPSP